MHNEERLHHIDNNVIDIKKMLDEAWRKDQINENIEILKNLFEERVTQLQEQISSTWINAACRVREVIQDGNEKICQEITTKSEEQRIQEIQTKNMLDFINTNTNTIKEIVIRNNKQAELNEYVQKIFENQRKDTENMEEQHRAIFEKVEENRKCHDGLL